MPNLLELNGTSYTNADFYLTVVDSFWDCPPDIPIELGLDYVEIIYNATSAACQDVTGLQLIHMNPSEMQTCDDSRSHTLPNGY